MAISNSFHVPTKLINSQATANCGFRNAVDAATGKILWQTADPDDAAELWLGQRGERRDVWRFFVRQDVCARCEDGKILWHFATKGSVIEGPSVVNGILNWDPAMAPRWRHAEQHTLRVYRSAVIRVNAALASAR